VIHAQREAFDDRDPFLLCLLGWVGLTRRLVAGTVAAGPASGPPAGPSRGAERGLDALVGLYAVTLATGAEVARRVRPADAATGAVPPAPPATRGSLLV
jgi:hypothetical protein